jgi:putative NADH-flavin reductase
MKDRKGKTEMEHPMKIIVLGATGGTGQEIVRQAIEQGHSVTAFVRSPERLKPFGDRLTIKQGDLLSRDALTEAMMGHDAVLSGFGPRVPISKADAHLLQQFADALTSAMPHAGVKRAVIVSTAFLFRNSVVPPAYLAGRLFFPGIVADATEMERTIQQSQLDWTIVRPPQLTDGPHTGKYRVQKGHLPLFGFKISRADAADCCLKAVVDPEFIGEIFGVSK